VWQLNATNVITRLSNLSLAGNSISNSLPPQSITLFVLSAGTNPLLTPGTVSSTNTFSFWLSAPTGQYYIIQSSSNLTSWLPVQTNLLSTSPLSLVFSTTNTSRFYRAVWLP
jgi:hypothetical protein